MKDLHIFTHIPKTGGTSFKRSVLERNFPEERIYRFKGLKRYLTDNLNEFDLVTGHYPYGVHYFTTRKCVYSTLLRHPIDHALSYYYFIKQCNYKDYKHPKLEEANQYSLIEFTRRNPNMQTHMIAGFPFNRVFGRSSKQLLKIAKRHLDEGYAYYGILENIEAFEAEISKAFNWDYTPVYEQTKITRNRPKRDELSAEDLATLTQIQAIDLEFYAYAADMLKTKRTNKLAS